MISLTKDLRYSPTCRWESAHPPTTSSQGARVQPLDPTTFKSINDSLHFLGKTDLYEFLGLPDTTSNEALSRAALEIYEDMQRFVPKTPE